MLGKEYHLCSTGKQEKWFMMNPRQFYFCGLMWRFCKQEVAFEEASEGHGSAVWQCQAEAGKHHGFAEEESVSEFIS